MGWRTVAVTKQAKLDYSMGYMVVRDAEQIAKIHIDEISVLIIENTATSVTSALLSKLIASKVKVIFCDEKRNPSSELVSYYGSYDCSKAIKEQIAWTQRSKQLVWTAIVHEKITNQANHLLFCGYTEQAKMLFGYLDEIEFGDITNREGHSAKVYFNAIFGKDFSRKDDNPINAALNYGYSLILSCINREIVSDGYLTSFGIHHDNIYNHFNLSCDIIEPFRPLVDFEVAQYVPLRFEKEEKRRMISLLNKDIKISGKTNTCLNSVRIYTKSVMKALTSGDISLIEFPEISYEL